MEAIGCCGWDSRLRKLCFKLFEWQKRWMFPRCRSLVSLKRTVAGQSFFCHSHRSLNKTQDVGICYSLIKSIWRGEGRYQEDSL